MRCCLCAGLRAGRAAGDLSKGALQIVNVMLAGLLVSACATSQAAYQYPANVGGPSERVAIAAPPPIEIEDDGTAAQAPPRRRRNAVPDDPSEPFSPNYGPAPRPSEPVKAPAMPSRKAAAEPAVLRPAAVAMSPERISAIIARAMVEHERRYP